MNKRINERMNEWAQGIYADLVPAWYAQVGQSLTIVIVLTVGLPHPAFVLYRSLLSLLLMTQCPLCFAVSVL